MAKRSPWQHPGRLLRLHRARLASLGWSILPRGKGRATGRPATASAARASHLQHRRFHACVTAQEDKRLRQEAQAAQRQEEARSRRQAARQEISAAYREVVIEQSAAEAAEAAEAEAEAAPAPTAPAEPTESHSEAVARMMRERHEAREQTQREVAELQGRVAARRAAAASSGAAAAAPRAAPVYDRSLFQRPLLPAEPTVPPPTAGIAGTAGAAAVGAGKSAPARDAWAWAQQREAPACTGEAVAFDAVLE